jgi:hypothetical protein
MCPAEELLGHRVGSLEIRRFEPSGPHAHLQRRLVAAQHDVRSEHRQQCLQVAAARGPEERIHDALLPRHVRRAAIFRRALHPPATTTGELAGSDGRAADNVGDLINGNAEDVVQHERHALGRCQALEHRQHGQPDRLRQQCLALRVGGVRNGCAVQRQRLLAPRLTRAQHIETNPPHDRGQPAAQVRHLAGVGAAQAQPGLLYRVVGLAGRAEQPVGHRPQACAIGLEAFRQPLAVHRSHSPARFRHRVDEPMFVIGLTSHTWLV